MKVKVITTCNKKQHPGFRQFIRSLEKFNWPYDISEGHYIRYGSKAINAYNHAKYNDYTHLFILDAFDIVVLGPMEEALEKIGDLDCVMFNAERACWPYTEWEKLYPVVEGPWKYLNGGAAFVNTQRYIQLFEENPIQHRDNDQTNFSKIYLEKRDRYNFRLDTKCEVFQSVAFQEESDFTYENNRLINNIHNTRPTIIHGNGGPGTDMSKVYNLL